MLPDKQSSEVGAQCSVSECFCSVQQSDNVVDVCPAEAGVSHVFQDPDFVFGGVTRYRELERQQEVVGWPEVLSY